jgi:hypothetical protein
MSKPKPDLSSWPVKSLKPSVWGLATRPTRNGTGESDALVGSSRPLTRQASNEFLASPGDVAQQSRDVDLADREANAALGGVHVDVAEEIDDHARL